MKTSLAFEDRRLCGSFPRWGTAQVTRQHPLVDPVGTDRLAKSGVLLPECFVKRD